MSMVKKDRTGVKRELICESEKLHSIFTFLVICHSRLVRDLIADYKAAVDTAFPVSAMDIRIRTLFNGH